MGIDINNDDYLSPGELIDEAEDSKIYSVKILLKSRSYEKVTLRLPPACSSCWIYKASAVLGEKPKPIHSNLGHFDLENINNLLPTSNASTLSDGAEKFKNLFDSFQSSGAGRHLDPSMMMMMNRGADQQDNNSRSQRTSPSETLMLKSYIDMKFEQLEKKVIKIIDEKDKINQSKLDRIINLLETKTDIS